MLRQFAAELVDDAPVQADDAEEETAPLFVPSKIQFGRFIESEPTTREWVIRDVLPRGIVGLLGAMGGAGKSFWTYLLGFSVTTGLSFLGMEMGEPGGFLYLAGEDDEDELHRRGRVILSHCTRLAHLDGEPLDPAMVSERLHVVSRVARNNLLTRAHPDGEVGRTMLVDRLVEAASRIPDLRMIVLDPKSRFAGGRANHEEDATRFVETLEAIREGTGATVLVTSHVNKAGIREGGGQEIVRGSTALVDGVRWVATLQKLRRDQAGDYNLQPDEASRYLRFDIPKNNYAPPFEGLWIRREAGGVMVPTELERVSGGRSTKAQEKYIEIVARLQALIRDKGAMTRTAIRPYATISGVLGAGDKTVRGVVERAVREGDLVDMQGELKLPVEGVE